MHPFACRVGALAVLLFAFTACSSGRPKDGGPDTERRVVQTTYALVDCSGYTGKDTAFTVDANGGRFTFGSENNSLTFDAGAVSGPVTFNVKRAPGNRARIDITGAVTEFDAPVRLRMDFSGCTFKNDPPRGLKIMQVAPHEVPVGGATNRSKFYIETLIDHFTGFAIAN